MRAVYPGTFDPVTFGHIDLIKRAKKIFDHVIVAVADNPTKQPLFSLEERLSLLKRAVKGMKGVEVDTCEDLLVDYVMRRKAGVVVRGVRMVTDFEYEFQMALTNRKICEKVETIFMMPSESYSYVSARFIKETARYGADVTAFVPSYVATGLKRKFAKNKLIAVGE